MGSHARRNNIVVGTAVLLSATAAAWFLVLSPRLAEAGELQTQADSMAATNLSQQHRLTSLHQMVKDAPAAAHRVQTLLARMPQQAELPQLFTQITAAARSAGISAQDISAITPSVPVPIDSVKQNAGPVTDAQQSAERARVQVAKLDIAMTVLGTDAQIRQFLRNVEQLDRDFLINGVTLAADPTKPGGARKSATVNATTFVLQSQLPNLEANVQQLLAQLQQSGVATQ